MIQMILYDTDDDNIFLETCQWLPPQALSNLSVSAHCSWPVLIKVTVVYKNYKFVLITFGIVVLYSFCYSSNGTACKLFWLSLEDSKKEHDVCLLYLLLKCRKLQSWNIWPTAESLHSISVWTWYACRCKRPRRQDFVVTSKCCISCD